jgi:hypothetical protein
MRPIQCLAIVSVVLGTAVHQASAVQPLPPPVAIANGFSGDLHLLGGRIAWQQQTCTFDCVYQANVETLHRFMVKRLGGATREVARNETVNFLGGGPS